MTTRYDIAIQQGARFLKSIQVRDRVTNEVQSLVGYSARMQIRSSKESAVILLEASTANGRISVNGPGGTITIDIGADVTEPLTWNTGFYDLEAYSSASDVIRVLEGNASLSLEVTRT